MFDVLNKHETNKNLFLRFWLTDVWSYSFNIRVEKLESYSSISSSKGSQGGPRPGFLFLRWKGISATISLENDYLAPVICIY